jgi:hypothetical protein
MLSWLLPLLFACRDEAPAPGAAPMVSAGDLPNGTVAADLPLTVALTVSDADSAPADLAVVVTGLEPQEPAAVADDGALSLTWSPPPGPWTVGVEVVDPEGHRDRVGFSFEAVDADLDDDGAISEAWGGTDCDDARADVAPGLPELCDGLDQDCDGGIDEDPVDGVPSMVDADGDGYGSAPVVACEAATTSVAQGGDCDDADPLVFPGQAQIGRPGCEGMGEAFEFLGEAPGERAGDNVRDAGDLDGDGYSEVLICAPEHDGAKGATYVVGALEPGKASLADARARLIGESPGDGACYDFISIGDVDADGDGDLLIGAGGYDGPLGGEGAVYLVLGPFAGDVLLADQAATLLVGSGAGDQLGDTSTGDLDGDGQAELVIGARLADVNGLDSGMVLVLDPPPPGEFVASDLAISRLLGETPGVIAGDPFPVGDLTGDGLHDLAIQTQEDATSGLHGGAVYVVHAPIPPGDVILDTADAKLIGNAGSLTGHFGDGAGDLDADGLDDLIVGAPYDDPNGVKSGAAYVVFGPGPSSIVGIEAEADAILQGDRPGIRAGFSVSRLGDLNLDGWLDVLVGAKYDDTVGYNAGAVYVAPGPFAGTTDLGLSGVKLLGEAANDLAGDVGTVEDLDGDGLPDILVGARHAAESGPDAGSAYLVFGAVF